MTALIIQFAQKNAVWLSHDGNVLGELAVANALEHEIRPDGVAFVDHPSDPGGATNYGISLRFLEGLISDGSVEADDYDRDGDGDVDGDDMRALTLQDARDLLWQEFWYPYRTGDLPPALAVKVFDMAVNMGQRQAVRLLQDALNAYMPNGLNRLVRDGVIGPRTIAAATIVEDHGASPLQLLNGVRDVMADFYQSLILRNPKFEAFAEGWRNRAMA